MCVNVLFLPQTGGGLQNRAEGWKDLVNHTRASRPRTPSRLEDNIVRYDDTIVILQKNIWYYITPNSAVPKRFNKKGQKSKGNVALYPNVLHYNVLNYIDFFVVENSKLLSFFKL